MKDAVAAKTYELMFTAGIIDAGAKTISVWSAETVPHEELMSATLAMADKIAAKPPISVKLAKAGIRKGLDLALEGVAPLVLHRHELLVQYARPA